MNDDATPQSQHRGGEPLFDRVERARPPDDLEGERVVERVRARLFGGDAAPLRVDRFTLIERVGTGGVGEVWCAYDPRLDRRVALKLLRTTDQPRPDEAVRRLLREARVAGRLSHPNIVSVFEVGADDGQPFLAMEFIEGPDLARWLRGRDRSPDQVLDVFVQAGRALAEAHRRNVVHRDFKPANVMLHAGDGVVRARVVDFGLAGWSHLGPAPAKSDAGTPSERDDPVTRTGQRMGTPAYMAPEQLEGGAATPQSDQFAYAVSLFEALTGERPFSEPGAFDAVAERAASLPATVRGPILRALALDPGARWPTMDALVDALDRSRPARGRRLAFIGAAASAVATVTVAVVFLPSDAARCDRGPELAQQVWNDTHREEVRAALLETAVPYAADTWARVERSFDSYAASWAERHDRICRATRVDGTQSDEAMDLRMGCMHEHLDELGDTVEVLTGGGAARVRNAVNVAAELAPLSRCDDVARLRAAIPPPQNPDVAAAVADVRRELSHTGRSLFARDLEAAASEADTLVDRATELQYPPLQAEARLMRGRVHHEAGRMAAAEADLQEAYALAIEHRHEDVEVDALLALTRLVGDGMEQYARGLQWGIAAEALSRARNGDELRQAHAANAVGTVLSARGDFDDALAKYDESLRRLQAVAPAHPTIPVLLTNIGNAQAGAGRQEASVETHRRALELEREIHGPRHPRVALALMGLGTALQHAQRSREALRYLEEALSITDAVHGARSKQAGQLRTNLGVTLMALDRLDEAADQFRRAREITESSAGKWHPRVASNLTNLGIIRKRQGRLSEARALQTRAVEILERTTDVSKPRLARVLTNLALVIRLQGEADTALAHLDRAFRIVREIDERHPFCITVLNNTGNVLLEQGRLEDGYARYDEAAKLAADVLGPDHRFTLLARYNVALAARQLGRYQEATDIQRDVLDRRIRTRGGDHPEVAASHVELAKCALDSGDAASARPDAERSVEILEATEANPSELAEARFTLARAVARDQRSRAIALAQQSRATWIAAEGEHEAKITKVDTWLSEQRR